jgi:hypothetical protein
MAIAKVKENERDRNGIDLLILNFIKESLIDFSYDCL